MLLCQQEWRKTSWWHLNKHLQESKVELCVGLTFPIGGEFLDEPNEVFLGVVEAAHTCGTGHSGLNYIC